MVNRLLIIGHQWPQPHQSAVGSRMMQLIDVFIAAGYHVTFACAVPLDTPVSAFTNLPVDTVHIALNHPSFDEFITTLQPDTVLYDRYITEEQYGWRVHDCCPAAMTILDTEDLHFLRKAREEAVLKKLEWSPQLLYTVTAKRELASMLRCDLSLIISSFEMELLTTQFQFPVGQLCYVPFMHTPPSTSQVAAWNPYNKRMHFSTIGTFMHKPNVDAVMLLHKHVWPRIKKVLPEAQLHIYGSYVTRQVMELHKPETGFHVLGATADALATVSQYRVLLAPLRFGAGLKGKLVDAMRSGTPAVMTPIAAEGMFGALPPCGLIAADPAQFAAAAVQLHEDTELWQIAVNQGLKVLQERFDKVAFAKALCTTIHAIKQDLVAHRNTHFMGRILQYHTMQSTKYLSKWIAEKEGQASANGFL